jgi:hypothetical protein
MQFARFVGTFGLFLALGFAGFAVGCGSQPASTPVTKEEGSSIKAQRKQDFLDAKELRKEAGGGGANRKRGRDRG